jgi:phosphatidylglycerol---prolipoprotein diacylglyceryl transferase
VLVEHRYYSAHPLKAFAVWEGGLVMYGGMLAVFFTVIGYAAKNHLNILRLCDLVAPAAFLGGAIGRWGCFFAGDDYGKPTDSWVGVRFTDPNSLVPEALRGVALHPAQLYMSAKCLLIFGVCMWVTRRKKFDGQVGALALLMYAVLRSIVELYRGDADRGSVGFLSSAQFTSIFVFFVALGLYWFVPRRTLADEKAATTRDAAIDADAPARKKRRR